MLDPELINELSEQEKIDRNFRNAISKLFWICIILGWTVILIESYFEVTR